MVPHWKWMRQALVLLLTFGLAAAEFRLALPGYRYEFPRDHFNHPGFQTEWWYYTGNLRARDGHRFGFELVFFRRGQQREASTNLSAWRADDLYLADLALTDIDRGAFHSWKRLNRTGPGTAGATREDGRIWNGNWQVKWDLASSVQTLSAVAEGVRLRLRLTPRTPPVIHGEGGVSQTGPLPGEASYYVSFPLLAAEGDVDGSPVTGTAWMDHEWFSNLLDPDQRGWDWFSVQLENRTELMLFQLRRTDGSTDPHSAGTYIGPDGRAVNLRHGDFRLQPLEYWTSPRTKARYPVKWRIEIPPLKLVLECAAAIPNQEVVGGEQGGATYWEGAAVYSGSAGGVGYFELTGYEKPLKM
jgi:predicted secreted hydrolase